VRARNFPSVDEVVLNQQLIHCTYLMDSLGCFSHRLCLVGNLCKSTVPDGTIMVLLQCSPVTHASAQLSTRKIERKQCVCEFDRPPAAAAADRAEFNIGRPTSRRRRRTLVPRCDGQVHVDSGRSAADVAQLGLANQWFILPFGDSAAAVDRPYHDLG
jgi:hypothetical protein